MGRCRMLDAIEELAIQRAGKLFGAARATAQPTGVPTGQFRRFPRPAELVDQTPGMDLATVATSPTAPRRDVLGQ